MVAQRKISLALSQRLLTVLKRRYIAFLRRRKQFMTKVTFTFKYAILIPCLATSVIAKEILDTNPKETLALK